MTKGYGYALLKAIGPSKSHVPLEKAAVSCFQHNKSTSQIELSGFSD